MDNEQIINFFKNLNYDNILFYAFYVLIFIIFVKLFYRINWNKVKTEKIRMILLILESMLFFISIIMLTVKDISMYSKASVIIYLCYIIMPINFSFMYTYLKDYINNKYKGVIMFFLSIFLGLFPATLISVVIYEISILLK